MYKVVIIDDDAVIRKGLRNILDWENLGFVISGEGKDGAEGLELIERLNPDLILTDIKMPKLDGLEMISRLRKYDSRTRIIVITAFRDFEYAKKALKCGVSDLILKPTKIDELIRAVRSAFNDLTLQKKLEDDLIHQKKLFKENIPLLKEKFLHDLIFGIEIPDGTEKERMKLFGLELSSYHILIIRFTGIEEQSNYNLYLRQIGISRLIEEVFQSLFQVQKIQFRTVQSAFLLTPPKNSSKKDSPEEYLKSLRTLSEELIQIVKNSIDLDITIGLSSHGCNISQLTRCYREATQALEKIFFTGSRVVLEFQEEADRTMEGLLELPSVADIENLNLAVKAGNKEKVSQWFELFKEESERSRITIEESRKISGEIFWKLNNSNSLTSLSGSETVEILKTIFDSNSFIDILEIIRQFAYDSTMKISDMENHSISNLVERARDIILREYKDHISLVSVSEQVYVSSSYLSRIFKKEEGVSFNEYLNKIRIDKAVELLIETKLKSYQIAESVGIQDPHYFSRIFKKVTGKSPSEYRPF